MPRRAGLDPASRFLLPPDQKKEAGPRIKPGVTKRVVFPDNLAYLDFVRSQDVRVMSNPLLEVPAKEVASKFGYYTDEAMLHPVGIQRHGTTRVVMISLKEYERLLRRDRQVLKTEDLDDETLAAILSAQPGERSKAAGKRLADPRAG